jgi:hypothetical protein
MGAFLALGAAEQTRAEAIGGLALLVVGAVLTVRPAYRRYADRRNRAADKAEFAARHQRELQVCADWTRLLAELRPGDDEMAQWLACDLAHLRREAMLDYRLTSHEVLFDFFTIEAAPDCVKARVRNGPVRCSKYRFQLFLMTSGGVRTSSWLMEFADGSTGGRQDKSFRYEAISSVQVERLSFRLDDQRKEIISVRDDGSMYGNRQANEISLREAMHLTLNNQQHLHVLVENYEQLHDMDHEDEAQLRRLALDTSGVSIGFHILVAVAAEGREWFEQQRMRSLRQLQKFIESNQKRQAALLAADAGPPALEILEAELVEPSGEDPA